MLPLSQKCETASSAETKNMGTISEENIWTKLEVAENYVMSCVIICIMCILY
jgi:hypothetical protein